MDLAEPKVNAERNTENSSSPMVNLPSGKPLSAAEASRLLRETTTPIVLLAGAVKSGKTTLLASLHDAFQWGPFAGYLAAGSKTLMGFEERCFDSRASSKADRATTGRTIVEEGQQYYHIRVRDEQIRHPIRNLLIADMSGEFYERAIDSAAETRDLTIIRRADHFVHLIDGFTLASPETRAHARSNALMLLRRCFEEKMLDSSSRVDILLTKWDIVLLRSDEATATALIDRYRALFSNDYGQRFARLRVHAVAARPHFRSNLEPAYGLTDLFRSWVEERPRQLEPRLPRIHIPELHRQFDKYALCQAAERFTPGV